MSTIRFTTFDLMLLMFALVPLGDPMRFGVAMPRPQGPMTIFGCTGKRRAQWKSERGRR